MTASKCALLIWCVWLLGCPSEGRPLDAGPSDGLVRLKDADSVPVDLFLDPSICNPGKRILDTTGVDHPFTVPANCTSIKVTMWGAGGGGGTSVVGGAGGYVTGILAVTPGEILTIKVGGGAAGRSIAAGGGGRSSVLRGSTELLTAGGGGGSAVGGAGGAAGGLSGSAGAGPGAGDGGTQSMGGIGSAGGRAFQGGHSDSPYPGSFNCTAGGWPNGGNSGHQSGVSNGGGGGDGYYGGGAVSLANGGGGGGGSSYLGAATSAVTQPGSGAMPYTDDPDYVSKVAIGGPTGEGNGGIGRVVIRW